MTLKMEKSANFAIKAAQALGWYDLSSGLARRACAGKNTRFSPRKRPFLKRCRRQFIKNHNLKVVNIGAENKQEETA